MKANSITKEARQLLSALEKGKVQGSRIEYQRQVIADLVPVKLVSIYKVFNAEEISLIRNVINPQAKECYRNSYLLANLFPDTVEYCEGYTYYGFAIEHAFNQVGELYVDITLEIALGQNVEDYEYAVLGKYDLATIERIASKNGYYGEYYRSVYIEKLKDEKQPSGV